MLGFYIEYTISSKSRKENLFEVVLAESEKVTKHNKSLKSTWIYLWSYESLIFWTICYSYGYWHDV